jgi:SAM-dependent methyltransferase
VNDYWDARFRSEGRIWGDAPSRTAEQALELFSRHGVESVLVPGAGYGRNTRLFSGAELSVTGVEVSGIAYEMAQEFDPASRFYHASVLDLSFLDEVYDAVYGFNILHLFRYHDRVNFIRQCRERVRRGGLLYFTVFSEREPSFGKGAEVEPGTFESKPGRPVHYFTGHDLRDLFTGVRVLATGLTEDTEDHGEEGPHTHILRYICVQT